MSRVNLPEGFINSVEKAELRKGDILFIRLGISAADMGGGCPAWVPSHEEVQHVYHDIVEVLPEGVTLFVTHMGVHPQVISPEEDDAGAN